MKTKAINWEERNDNIGHTVSVRIDKESFAKVDEISRQYGIPRGTIVRDIVKYYFNNCEKGNK